MIESTKIWTTSHRGVDIRFWQAGQHWFAVAPGQEQEIQGQSTLRAALQSAFDFVNDGRRLRFSPQSRFSKGQAQPLPQPARDESVEQKLLQAAVG